MSGFARRLVVSGYVLAIGGEFLTLLFVPQPDADDDCAGCPENLLGVVDAPTAEKVASAVVQLLAPSSCC